jgi:hypothetical protein
MSAAPPYVMSKGGEEARGAARNGMIEGTIHSITTSAPPSDVTSKEATRVKPSGDAPVIFTHARFNKTTLAINLKISWRHSSTRSHLPFTAGSSAAVPLPHTASSTPACSVVTVCQPTKSTPLTAIASASPSALGFPTYHIASSNSLSHPPAVRPARRRS